MDYELNYILIKFVKVYGGVFNNKNNKFYYHTCTINVSIK